MIFLQIRDLSDVDESTRQAESNQSIYVQQSKAKYTNNFTGFNDKNSKSKVYFENNNRS